MEHLQAMMQTFWDERPEERLILGIDGLSRSGKTTISRLAGGYLKERGIPYCLIHLDDLIVEKKRRYGTGLEEWQEYYFKQWEIGALAETLFSKLKNADEVLLGFYEPEADRRTTKRIRLPKKGIILVEGVFLQRPEWRPHMDKVVYIDCPREQRFERESPATKKEMEKFRHRYWKAEMYYEKAVMPIKHADLTFNTGVREIGETL